MNTPALDRFPTNDPHHHQQQQPSLNGNNGPSACLPQQPSSNGLQHTADGLYNTSSLYHGTNNSRNESPLSAAAAVVQGAGKENSVKSVTTNNERVQGRQNEVQAARMLLFAKSDYSANPEESTVEPSASTFEKSDKPDSLRTPLKVLYNSSELDFFERINSALKGKSVGDEILLDEHLFMICRDDRSGRRYLQKKSPKIKAVSSVTQRVPTAEGSPLVEPHVPPVEAQPQAAQPLVDDEAIPREDFLSLCVKLTFAVFILTLDGNMMSAALMVLISLYVLLAHLGAIQKIAHYLVGTNHSEDGNTRATTTVSGVKGALYTIVGIFISFFTSLLTPE